MKKKELKEIAKRIADAEYIIQTETDPKKTREARSKILELSHKVTSMEDLLLIDELVQDILSEKV